MLSKAQEFRRAWPVLAASILGGGTGVAVLMAYSLGAFVAPLTHAFGWTRAEVTAAALFTAFGYLAAGAVVGGLADRYGARRVALTSQLLLVLALAAMTRMNGNLWLYYAASFGIAMLGAGTLPITWSRAITGWFVRSRGFALGISLFGTGIAGFLLPTYVSWLVERFGWQGGYIGVAALPLVIGMPLALLFFREPPGDHAATVAGMASDEPAPPASYTFKQAIGTVCFWQMALSFFIAATTVSAVLVHALPLMMDRGVDQKTAAILAGLFGPGVILGRLVSGYCLDMFEGPKVAVAVFVISGLACGVLALAGDHQVLGGLAIIFVGMSAGAEADIAAYFTARYFGRANFGAIYGLLYTLYCIGGGVGPSVAGTAFDLTGSYAMALYCGMGGFLVAAALAGLIRAPRRREPEPVAVGAPG